MNNAWSTEITRLLFLLVSIVVFGFVSSYWLLSIILHFVMYITWVMLQLGRFERWIRNGAHSLHAPDTSGIWALIVQHIYRTQKKNKDRKQSLSNLAKRYQAIMKALPDATIVLNEHLEIEWANQIAVDVLGVDIERDTGHRVDNIIRALSIQELLKGEDAKNEIEFVSPIDEHKTLILSKVRFGESQILLTARDISQRIALQKMRKAFIANASHELRTPLTVISGYLEMLNDDDQLPSSMKNLMSNAHLQAVRMDRILNDLLVLSKLEEKGFSEDRGEKLDAANLLKQVVADFEKISVKKSHSFEINIEEGLDIILIEREFISLCQNLLGNAIKYSADGSMIKLCWQLGKDNHACLRVSDSGEGIAPEHLSRLTERFYRINVNRSRKVGGTGLGLSIVKHIMDNCGGYLDIKSELNVGSTFMACFPENRIFKNGR